MSVFKYSTYDFLFDFNRKYASIVYRFRFIASYLSKVAIAYFNLYHSYIWRHHWGRSNFAETFGDSKLESLCYRMAFFRDSTFSRFDTISACDGQTDSYYQREHTSARVRSPTSRPVGGKQPRRDPQMPDIKSASFMVEGQTRDVGEW